MNAEEYARQGYELLKQEKYEQALHYFQLALAQESTHHESIYGLARTQFKLENFEESIQAFDRLINLIPNNATYYSERGVALHWVKSNDLALADFDKAVDLEPENPYRYSSRAYIKDRLNDSQGAIDDYTKAIELDPEDAIAYNNRGMIEEKLGHLERARNSYQQADALDQSKNGKPRSTPVTERNQEVPASKQTIASPKPTKQSGYWQEIRSVFTSRQQFRDFLQFLGNPFRKP
uniref:Tetratricopeptide repeat protein n=1 Tax=Roseihalotalea indica TaxID=2867963 RepID=A0AA49GPN0_9BACT|nr:tetratricopeptide repeat protein [Tunicatimonas sp. TK19036]